MKLSVVALMLSLVSATNAWAQGGAVAGTVSDETGGVLPGVTVQLLPAGTQSALETVTDGSGVFHFEGVPQGTAELTIRLINFSTVRRNINVTAGTTTKADVSMVVATSADMRLRAIGLINMSIGVSPLGFLLAGLLGELLGARHAILALAVAGLVAMLFVLRRWPVLLQPLQTPLLAAEAGRAVAGGDGFVGRARRAFAGGAGDQQERAKHVVGKK